MSAPRLHLKPLSRAGQRLWYIGDARPTPDANGTGLHLHVLPDDHRTYVSLRAVLAQLDGTLSPRHAASKARLEQRMDAAGCGGGSAQKGSDAELLADSVTFAITRRISRESVHTAPIVDRAAHLLNSVFAEGMFDRVHVHDVDRLDRGTLKVLARAMLLLEPHHGFAWVWHSSADPTSDNGQYDGDLYLASRSDLMRQLVGIVQPTLGGTAASRLRRPAVRTGSSSVLDLSVALVLQNYDACFLWADQLACDDASADAVDILRIRALAAVNIGRLSEALSDLAMAEARTSSAPRQAHLAYLQGLIEAKRHYDLSRSRTHYERGLEAISRNSCTIGDGEEDPALEQAWLLNGIALNEAILWRRDRADTDRLTVAFALLQDAFALVAQERRPPRIYLRSNLLANSALLLEMRGQHDRAIRLFQSAFENSAQESTVDVGRWQTILGYRLGVLHYRMGELEPARRLLQRAAEDPDGTDNWPIRERVLRAVGVVALARAANHEALDAFTDGLRTCRQQRSREGVQEHGRGVAAALVALGRRADAADLTMKLAGEEDVDVLSAGDIEPLEACRPGPLTPKLPAYLPEIDLEGLPEIDLNRFLVGAVSHQAQGADPWTTSR